MHTGAENWTKTHDLTLVFLAMAYGTDRKLDDAELEAITHVLREWQASLSLQEAQEIVMEAMAVLLENGAGKEVSRAIESLGTNLQPEMRQRALEDLIRIAEADGVVLESERSLINELAKAWSIKSAPQDVVIVEEEVGEEWGLLHDVALVYLVVAHSSDNVLSTVEVETMIERLREWQPDATVEDAKHVLNIALQQYAQDANNQKMQEAIQSVRDNLPIVQRLAVLNDLVHIAESDGQVSKNESNMINTLSDTWDIGIQFDPEAV